MDQFRLSRRQLVQSGLTSVAAFAVADVAAAQEDWRRRAEQMRADAVAQFPYEIIRTPGRDALATWERLRGEGRRQPIILGGDEDFARTAENLGFMQQEGRAGAAAIAAADGVRFPQDLRTRRRADLVRTTESLRQTNPELAQRLESYSDDEGDEIPHGDWIASPSPRLSVVEELVFENGGVSRRTYPEVIIALLPATNSADALGLLGFGGWNECPFPFEHVAAWRHWNAQYGAEIIGVSGDVINARVRSRPASRAAALALGTEQFEYCSDIVHQGVGTIEALAASLMADDWWYFWWD